METITIINKSGKVVKTGKHLINIWKDAKVAYQEKKAEMRAEQQHRLEAKAAAKLLKSGGGGGGPEDGRSTTSSRRSQRSRSSSHHPGRGKNARTQPLTTGNLSRLSEVSSVRGASQHRGERHEARSVAPGDPPPYSRGKAAFVPPHPGISRRHTDQQIGDRSSSSKFMPPPRSMTTDQHHDYHDHYQLQRFCSRSESDLREHEREHEHIDMDLAYGDVPPPLPTAAEEALALRRLMGRLDRLVLEARCVQHSAGTVIASLQADPDAMAAVALTLAEISRLAGRVGPGALALLRASAAAGLCSPAVLALLLSPEFLVAGGVAVGVTVVMLGGYKIVKRIRASSSSNNNNNNNNSAAADDRRREEALAFGGGGGYSDGHGDGYDDDDDLRALGSIDEWRRGIAVDDTRSLGTGVDEELITLEAAKIARRRKKDGRAAPAPASRASHRPDRSEVGTVTVVAEDPAATAAAAADGHRAKSHVRRSGGGGGGQSVASAKTSRSEGGVARDKAREKEKRDGNGKAKNSPLTLLFRKRAEGAKPGAAKATAGRGGHHRPQVMEI